MREERLEAALAQSPKYGQIDEAVRRRVLRTLMPRYGKEKDVLEAAKRHLHIICGMYQGPREWKAAEEILRAALPLPPDAERLRQTAGALLAQHASTRERMESLPGIYDEIFARLPPVRSVLDVGCGFHPFARPWMPLASEVRYTAYDLLPETARQISAFFDWAGYAGRGGVCDLMEAIPQEEADLAFLMKLLPVLEQQRKGRGAAVLAALNARYLVVTFPLRSMGGQQRGMAAHYGGWMEEHLDGRFERMMARQFGNELLYLLKKKEAETEEIT